MENTLVTEQKIIQDVKAPFFSYDGIRKFLLLTHPSG
jgi:hypothetical protein